jgi:O-antigen/teichoic acid export membrane protein
MSAPRESDLYSRSRVRRALIHFLTGRAVSGVLGLVSLLLIVRWLAPADFGLYAALLSIQVVFLAVSSFGIETAMERYLPEVRLKAGAQAILPFIGGVLLLRVVVLAAAAAMLLALLAMLLPLIGLEGQGAAVRSYVWVILATALMNLGGVALEALLHQKPAQFAAMSYATTRLFLLIFAIRSGTVSIEDVIRLDLAAAVLGALINAAALARYARGATFNRTTLADPGLWRRVRSFAMRNYAAQTLMQAYGVHAMRLGVTSLSGLAETARLGFAMSLSDVVQRYLPALLLMRMIRPVFVSRYVERNDFSQLNGFANIVLKLNILFLAPALAFVASLGDRFSALISGGQYADARWLLFGSLALLVSSSHQTVVSILANTLEANDIQVKAALCAVVGVPVGLTLIPLVGAYGALAASLTSAVVYNAAAASLLRRRGHPYRVDFGGIARIFAAAAAAALAAWLATAWLGAGGPTTLLVGGAVLVLVFVPTAILLKGFTVAERDVINSLLPRRIFPF